MVVAIWLVTWAMEREKRTYSVGVRANFAKVKARRLMAATIAGYAFEGPAAAWFVAGHRWAA